LQLADLRLCGGEDRAVPDRSCDALDVLGERTVVAEPLGEPPDRVMGRAYARPRLERRQELDRLCACEELDREDVLGVGENLERL